MPLSAMVMVCPNLSVLRVMRGVQAAASTPDVGTLVSPVSLLLRSEPPPDDDVNWVYLNFSMASEAFDISSLEGRKYCKSG